MKTGFPKGSSLTFHINNSTQIQEVLRLIRDEASKEQCSDAEITLIRTAVSEVCRRFLEYSDAIDLTISLQSCGTGMVLQGRVSTDADTSGIPLEKVMSSLNAYFDKSSHQKNDGSSNITYSFHKEVYKNG